MTSINNEKWLQDRLIKEDRIRHKIKTTAPSISKHKIISLVANKIRSSKLLSSKYIEAMRNAYSIRDNKIDIYFSNLPIEFDGFKILHLSDLHLDSLPNIHNEIIKIINSKKYDACIITGDYTEGVIGDFSGILADFSEIINSISANHGIFTTLGNHDSAMICEPLERMGTIPLNNNNHVIKIGDAQINIIGLDDVHLFYTQDIHREIESINRNEFNIMAVHSPEAYRYTDQKIDLYLTGHTHGGQVNFPMSMNIYKPLDNHCSKDMIAGLWNRGRTTGYTSCGIGTSVLPIRYNSNGEVCTITLKRGAQKLSVN